MNTKAEIEGFLAQKTLALVGLSRDEKAFSAAVNRELKAKGYRTIPVNPNAKTIAGDTCYPSLAAVPEKVGGVVIFTQPGLSEKVVREAAAARISRVWLQQGAQSDAAVEAAREKGLGVVCGKCILMFAEPVGSFHSVHRWFAKIFGQLPK
jgi:predicted CoA-binding protein